MKRIFTIALFCFCHLDLFSQSGFKVYDEYIIEKLGKTFQMGHMISSDFEIIHDGTGKLYYENVGTSSESMEKAKPVNMIIRMIDEDGVFMQKFEISYNDLDIDLSGFRIHYLGKRKFLVFTAGRYRFFILNLSTNKVVGPYFSGVEGAASDSQDGTVCFTEVFNQGQYLIGYAQNFGLFCFNLIDLNNPKTIDHICTDNQHLHNGYFFLDKIGDNFFNGLFIGNHRYGSYDSTRFIFQGKMLVLDENGAPKITLIDHGNVQLNEIKGDGQVVPLRINIQTGKGDK